MRSHIIRQWLFVVLAAGMISAAQAQDRSITDSPANDTAKFDKRASATLESEHQKQAYELLPGEDPQNRLISPFLKHLVTDQEDFWSSPIRLQRKDLRWAVPFTAFTGTLIASDSWISKQVPDKPNQLKHSQDISNYALYSLIGAGGGAFLWGHITNNDHLKETGLLSGEAAINSTAVTYLFKGLTQRPRPLESNGHGTFFEG